MVRDARAEDAVAVALLLTELGYPCSADAAARRLSWFAADPGSRVVVIEREGEVAGLVATHVVPRLDSERPGLRIVDIVVAERHRRAGVGRALLEAAEAEARRLGCGRLALTSGEWRAEAHAFYAALGFEANGQGFTKLLS